MVKILHCALQVPGHASSIAKVRFTSDGRYLIALGQFNRIITQYIVNDFGSVVGI